MPRKYSAEFKKDAVDLVFSPGRSIPDVARELGMSTETLRGWVNKTNRQESGVKVGYGVAELEELTRLRKQVRELELEKEILRKAAQYFAKEMGR